MKPENVSRIEQKIGYVFKDKKLFKVCFSHSSYTNEHGGENNERLEFLGDALLGAFVAVFLFQTTRDNEGKMTEKRKALVAAAPLKTAIERMGLQKFILAGGDGQNVGEKAISSLFEAIVAGIYVDGGADAAKNFITTNCCQSQTRTTAIIREDCRNFCNTVNWKTRVTNSSRNQAKSMRPSLPCACTRRT